MSKSRFPFVSLLLPALLLPFLGCTKEQEKVQRPERIVSLRVVLYDSSTYAHLADLWQRYYEAYPSEDAYANWMYAARYAGARDYEAMLKKGLSRYPANPTILYLSGLKELPGSTGEEARRLLEESATLDPAYEDPWYALTTAYMQQGDRERTDIALRHLLEVGAVAEEVMDLSYNMLACLEKDAILVTNGDNDTYPGWILTRIVGFRPDVRIVNRSLLNTDWYPSMVIEEGVPAFVTKESMKTLLEDFSKKIKEPRSKDTPSWPFGDVLVSRLIEASVQENRSVYFACTVEHNPLFKRHLAGGTNLGLVTLVTPSRIPSTVQLRNLLEVWFTTFRTGGLDSWQLGHSSDSRAGRRLMVNYAGAMHSLLPAILELEPDYRLRLFRWYKAHLWKSLPLDAVEESNRMWCERSNPQEIDEWCRKLGYAAP